MQQPSPRNTAPPPTRSGRRGRRIAAVAALGLTGLLAGLLSGCGNGVSSATAAATSSSSPTAPAPQYTAASGNWLFATPSARLSSIAGSLTVSGTTVTGTLHPLASSCATALTPVSVSGTIATGGVLTVTSSSFAGGTLTIQGTLAPDLHSLTNPTVTVTGGSCSTAQALRSPQPRDNGSPSPTTTAQQYQALTGTYIGTLTSSFGGSLAITVSIAQGASPDASGNYHLSGNATFADSSCVSSPVITDSVVSGNTVSTTYTDPTTGNSVTGTGTFSPDAQTLSISTWTLSGSCGTDHGFGTLARH